MRVIWSALVVLAVVAVFYWWPQRPPGAERGSGKATSTATSGQGDETGGRGAIKASDAASGPTRSVLETDFPIVAPLNRPDSTVARDLDVLQEVFQAWLTSFPREGNPVGENADITAALCGDNRLGLALIPKNHPAINGRGELCDRWGTPFRFHQISGTHMEVRSAGPDRRFATADDALSP